MSLRKITKIIIIAIAIALIVYDIFVYIYGGGLTTISNVILSWSTKWPFINSATFFLMGHLFWPQKIKIKNGKQ